MNGLICVKCSVGMKFCSVRKSRRKSRFRIVSVESRLNELVEVCG